MDESLLVAQLVVAGALAGLCWTVQLAVYPQFGRVLDAAGPDGFRAYHGDYTRGVGLVAAPLMLAELGLAGGWVWRNPGLVAGAGAVSVGLLWGLTFVVLVPLHRRLQAEPRPALVRRLVRWNGARTALWSLRAAGLAWLMASGA